MYFDELHDALKLNIAQNVQDSKTFLNLIASSKSHGLSSKYIQERLQHYKTKSFHKLIQVLFEFTTECLELEHKFLNNHDVRNKHLELFLNGYAEHNLLEDNANFAEYNNTFEAMVYEMASNMIEYNALYRDERIRDLYVEIINKLRLRNQLKESAKHILFQQVEDDIVDHEIEIEFESGVHVSIIVSMSKPSDAYATWIDIEASFAKAKTDKKHISKFVISAENEDYDDETDDPSEQWITNDPVEWIVTFIKNIKKELGEAFILGNIKNINYKYDGQQFWAKAYMLVEVLPKLM
jgi:hypothetical protein